MTRRVRPAVNLNTYRPTIATKANLGGWAITTCPTYEEGVTELILTRDDWRIYVGFKGHTAFAAAIQYPGQTHPAGVLSLGLLSRYLRGDRSRCRRSVVASASSSVTRRGRCRTSSPTTR